MMQFPETGADGVSVSGILTSFCPVFLSYFVDYDKKQFFCKSCLQFQKPHAMMKKLIRSRTAG